MLLLSAGVGFIRGFVNEVFTLFGWVGAILVTLYLTPVSKEFMRGFVESHIVADLITAAAIFLVTISIFSIITHFFGESVKQSKLNAIDRSLGFGFGVLRGLLLLGLAYIVFSFVWEKDKQPEWIVEARTHSVVEGTADWLADLAPEEDEDGLLDLENDEETKFDLLGSEEEQTKDESGYDDTTRSAIESLFQSSDEKPSENKSN